MTVIFTHAPAAPEVISTVIIIRGEIVIEPVLVDGYESTRTTGSLVHPILGLPTPEVTLRPAQLRTGTLRLVFPGEFVSADAETQLSVGGVFTLKSSDRVTVIMDFVPFGKITRALDDETRDVWIVSVDFQEV